MVVLLVSVVKHFLTGMFGYHIRACVERKHSLLPGYCRTVWFFSLMFLVSSLNNKLNFKECTSLVK